MYSGGAGIEGQIIFLPTQIEDGGLSRNGVINRCNWFWVQNMWGTVANNVMGLMSISIERSHEMLLCGLRKKRDEGVREKCTIKGTTAT